MKYGLIGEKLPHSWSKAAHGFLGNPDYELLELKPDEVDGFLRGGDFRGINVTIPYKETVKPYCVLEEPEIGSVNTIINRNGTLYGYNTDYFGFSYTARRAGIAFKGKKIVVLGSGGTSKTAVRAARDAGAREIAVVSRRGKNNYENLDAHADCDVLVNTTPVGMFPDNGQSPAGLSLFPRLAAVIDVIYNPMQTKLLLDARARGLRTAGGLAMLTAQALRAHNLFFSIPPGCEEAKIEKTLRQMEKQFANIVLIGMPGCGKTTIGASLARHLGKAFFDTDAVIESTTGRPPQDIITQDGEARFREMESAAIAEAAQGTNQVIATGGGSVLAEENRGALLQNGIVIFLERPLGRLATMGRPLSADLQALYARRLPVYEKMCRYRIGLTEDLQENVRRISEVLA